MKTRLSALRWKGSMQSHVANLSQETLRNLQIVRVGNPQFFGGIVEDIHGIVKGCPQNCQRVFVDLQKDISTVTIVKGIRGILLYSQNSRRVVGLQQSKGWNRRSATVHSCRQSETACEGCTPTYIPTYVDRGGRFMVYVSVVTYLLLNHYCYLLPVQSLCAIFVYSRDIPRRTKTLTL